MFGRLDDVLRDYSCGRIQGWHALRMHSTAVSRIKEAAYQLTDHPGVLSCNAMFGLDVLPDETLDKYQWALVKVEYDHPDPERFDLAVKRIETVVEMGIIE